MSRSRRAVRNVLVTVATQILSWGMTLAVTLMLPRYVGAGGLGKLEFSVSFIGFFTVMVSLGTSTVLVKNIARERGRAGEMLLTALTLRVPLAALLCGVAVLLSWALGKPLVTREIILLYGIGMTVSTTNEVLTSVLQGLEQMTRQSAAALLEKAIYSGGVIALIHFRAPLPAFAAVPIFSGLASLVFGLSIYRAVGPPPSAPSALSVRQLAAAGMPFLMWSVFRTLYGQTDPFVIGMMTNDATVGWYAAAFKLVNTTLFFPNAVTVALLPTLANLYAEGQRGESGSESAFWDLARRMLWLLILVGAPIMVVLLCVPERIIHLIYPPEYAPVAGVLRVGGFAVLLFYVASALGSAVIASDGQVKMSRSSIAAASIGIPACILGVYLTHRFWGNGAIGAIASDVLLELFLVGSYLRMMPPGVYGGPDARRMARLPLAVAPMAALLIFSVRGGWGGLWIVAPAAALYAAGCLLFRCMDPREYIGLLRGALQRKAGF